MLGIIHRLWLWRMPGCCDSFFMLAFIPVDKPSRGSSLLRRKTCSGMRWSRDGSGSGVGLKVYKAVVAPALWMALAKLISAGVIPLDSLYRSGTTSETGTGG